jgi:hypothetical protein
VVVALAEVKSGVEHGGGVAVEAGSRSRSSILRKWGPLT